jgi:translation initiation factor eIF-2B subunit delta
VRKGPPAEPKPKLSKAERRDLQESQRAAKAEKAGGAPAAAAPKPPPSPAAAASASAPAPAAAAGVARSSSGGAASSAAGAPSRPRVAAVSEAVQFDDKRVVARLQKKSLVPRKESDKAVELFAHLPQFDQKSLQDALAASTLSAGGAALHPAVLQLGCHYADGTVGGGRARCLALLRVLRKVIADYVTPPERTLARDLTARLNVVVQFLIDCRPLSVSMGNAIKSVKTALADAGQRASSEADAKAALLEHIDRYMQERILLADAVIHGYVCQKIRDGDVILTHAASATVLGALKAAHDAGRRFRVVVVDSRPRLEGCVTLAALLRSGISCTYTHTAALSYVMRGVSLVLLGAAAVLGNGAVVSRVGAASVAMVARAHGVPVLVCAQTAKLHERTQLDSITNNELFDPDALVTVQGRPDVTFLAGWDTAPRLRLLNLAYDATPAEFVTMIVTEVGMLPPTSVPVVLREYRKEVTI